MVQDFLNQASPSPPSFAAPEPVRVEAHAASHSERRLPEQQLLLPGLLFLGSVGLLVGLHARAVALVPLPAYGLDGAEMLPQLQRLVAWHALHEQSTLHSSLADVWKAVDGHYPPGMHVITAMIQRMLRLPRADVLFPPLLNLLGLAFTSALVGWQLTTAWPRSLTWKPDWLALRAALGVSLLMLTPGIAFTTRRYYYDLPMTLLVLLVACILCCGRGLLSWTRAWLGVGLTVLTLVIKWAAGLYLLPVWMVAFVLVLPSLRERRRKRWLPVASIVASVIASIVALFSLGACCAVWWMPESLAFQLGLAAQSTQTLESFGTTLASRSMLYLNALIQDGLGMGLTCLLAGALLLGVRTPRRNLRLLRALGAPLLIGLYLITVGPVPDGRYLMPILPWLTLGVLLVVPVRWPRTFACGGVAVAMMQLSLLDLTTREGLEPWQEWWWTSAAESRASSLYAIAPVVKGLHAQPGLKAVWIVRAPGQPSWEHLLAYALELEAPGTQVMGIEAQSTPSAVAPVWGPSGKGVVLLRWKPPPDSPSPAWLPLVTDLGPCWIASLSEPLLKDPP